MVSPVNFVATDELNAFCFLRNNSLRFIIQVHSPPYRKVFVPRRVKGKRRHYFSPQYPSVFFASDIKGKRTRNVSWQAQQSKRLCDATTRVIFTSVLKTYQQTKMVDLVFVVELPY